MEVGGENLLVPSDFMLDQEIVNGSTRLSEAAVESSALTAREGAIIGFATKDGNVALDDAKLRPGHSPFTAALMEHLVRTDLPLGMLTSRR